MKTNDKLPIKTEKAGVRPPPGEATWPTAKARLNSVPPYCPGLQSAIGNRQSAIGFTLIELLTVIAIMAVLAAMIFPVLAVVKKKQYLNTASAELHQIASALEDYHAKYNTYPPSNPSLYPGVNTLYYELSGVTVNANTQPSIFTTLDGACQINANDYSSIFGVSIGGIVNCTKGGEEGSAAKPCLSGLRANRIGTSTLNGIPMTNLVTSVRGPDAAYLPLGPGFPDVNPFCYSFPGTNNPASYDLWIDLRISGKTNRICNWRSAPFTL